MRKKQFIWLAIKLVQSSSNTSSNERQASDRRVKHCVLTTRLRRHRGSLHGPLSPVPVQYCMERQIGKIPRNWEHYQKWACAARFARGARPFFGFFRNLLAGLFPYNTVILNVRTYVPRDSSNKLRQHAAISPFGLHSRRLSWKSYYTYGNGPKKALLGTVAMQTQLSTLPSKKRPAKMAREARHFVDEVFFCWGA